MNNKERAIKRLLETKTAPAPDVTKPLKNIGDGNMYDGIRNLYHYAETEGEKKGLIEGSVLTLATGAAFFVLYKSAKFAKGKFDERKEKKAMEQKIYNAFKAEYTKPEDIDIIYLEKEIEKAFVEGGEENADVSNV